MSRRDSGSPARRPRIRCLLVEPHALYAAGVRDLLEREPDIEVVGDVRSPDEAVDSVASAAPDVMVVDVDLPDPDAVAATQRLRREAPDAPLVMLGRSGEDDVMRAVQAGASAHVADNADPSALASAIRQVARGDEPIADAMVARRELAQQLLEAYRDLSVNGPSLAAPVQPPLTARELEVLALVGEGQSNRAIADALGLRPQTIKNHLSSVLKKLSVRSRTQAVLTAVREGWIELEPADGSTSSGPGTGSGQGPDVASGGAGRRSGG